MATGRPFLIRRGGPPGPAGGMVTPGTRPSDPGRRLPTMTEPPARTLRHPTSSVVGIRKGRNRPRHAFVPRDAHGVVAPGTRGPSRIVNRTPRRESARRTPRGAVGLRHLLPPGGAGVAAHPGASGSRVLTHGHDERSREGAGHESSGEETFFIAHRADGDVGRTGWVPPGEHRPTGRCRSTDERTADSGFRTVHAVS